MRGETLPSVRLGLARVSAHASVVKSVFLNLGLPLRHQARLNRLIATEVRIGRYMRQTRFEKEFAPTHAKVDSVVSWARKHGFQVTYVSPDGLTIAVRGSAKRVSAAMHVHLSMYHAGEHVFYANNSDPLVPARLGLQSITGLNDRYRVEPASLRRSVSPGQGYVPSQFRAAYDVAGHGTDGTGQVVGLTGFGAPTPQSDLTNFAAATGDPAMTTSTWTPNNLPPQVDCQDQVQWVQIGQKQTEQDAEEALDVEYAHGMAAHSCLRYFLGGNGDEAPMEQAISMAVTDPQIQIVSNSWSQPGVKKSSDGFLLQTTNSFKEAVAVGKTFFFSTGDNATSSGCWNIAISCVLPAYPAASRFVVAVGGTNLQMDQSFSTYDSETPWEIDPYGVSGTGGGCATFQTRPAWQKGVSLAASCKGRAIPDLSADGDPDTGADVYWGNGARGEWGGTSLSSPLIAGMFADSQSYITAAGHGPAVCKDTSNNSYPCLGFAGPDIYHVAASTNRAATFHDVTCGSDGYPAIYGWDQANGWGSLDWFALTEALAGQTVTPVTPEHSWVCEPPPSTSHDLHSIACRHLSVCHVVGGSGVVMSTTDGWEWCTQSSSTPGCPSVQWHGSGNVASIACPRVNVCYAVGTSGWFHATTDGGRHWTLVALKTSGVSDLSCPGVGICFAVAGQTILATTDAKHFTEQSNPSSGPIVAIRCSTRYACTAIQSNGVVLRTKNAGGRWNRVPDSGTTVGNIAAMDCPDQKSCYAVGTALTPASPEGPSAFIYSTADGTSWKSQIVGGNKPLAAVACYSTTMCDAAGQGGTVLRTIDGSTWAPAVSPTLPATDNFLGVSCPSARLCFVIGKGGKLLQIGTSPGY